MSLHEARASEADPGKIRGTEQGEACTGNSAPSGRPQLEMYRRQVKKLSKSEPSAALVQPLDNPPCASIYIGFVFLAVLDGVSAVLDGVWIPSTPTNESDECDVIQTSVRQRVQHHDSSANVARVSKCASYIFRRLVGL